MQKVTQSNKLFSHGWKILFFGCLTVLLSACGSSNKSSTTNPTDPTAKALGFIYTTTNSQTSEGATNAVLRLTRYDDGSLANELSFPTGGTGGANNNRGDIHAGGDARGDFDSQGAIQIIDGTENRYMLVVNAGAMSADNSHGSISVFSVDKTNGDLALIGTPVNSGGTRPVSITYTPKKHTDGQIIDNEYWVVVGNQWGNPNVQKGGIDKEGNSEGDLERYPSNDFFFDGIGNRKDLSEEDNSDNFRNITLFSFDTSNGQLTGVEENDELPRGKVLDTYNRKYGGPTTVTFSENGKKLAVSTWGIAHFYTNNPRARTNSVTGEREQRESKIYVYDFDAMTGAILNNRREKGIEGIAGTIGISWGHESSDIIYASNFNLSKDLRKDWGLTVFDDSDGISLKNPKFGGHFPTAPDDDIDEACWTAVSPDGSRLYVSSFGTNVISFYKIKSNDVIDDLISFTRRRDTAPAGDTKDMYITPDNKYLYSIGAFESFSMNTFEITESGLEYKSQYIFDETKPNENETPEDYRGRYNFLGLAGFDLASTTE
ncbi:hypothetical protein D5R81_11525 [Parashewanella spongiae]|uniref:Uncharacterized protein n=1 Tax=Parashewanella spongiae TaxID=342950 RepID=A0A3A6TLQ1_9GAMM|nr:hypothetical protein [Parashewanella spongiae]MCL1079433.1 hypothetical protein [Parashewanella spongiae]RJY13200.1 hypothetical protein D5R81_11525 [Parashewanella spongiae]